ncbi:MAG TPA: DUF4097 family beta strand repeat-containing protein [Gemmatimonadaceae bacterium]|nr:DUF4097 family beta strand repeat-containing protein [Gemmatimonadaceae bacterium]
MKRMISALALAAIVTMPLSVAAQVGRDAETWTWDGRVEAGRWFKLSNVNGAVIVEPSSDNMVHVRAEKTVRRGSVTDVAFQVVQSGGDVRICALWRRSVCDEDGMRSRRGDDNENDRSDVKVRFTVRVPRGVRLDAGTVNGSVSVRELTSDVNASTVNGAVEVKNVGGQVKASTVNGAVDVTTRTGPVTANTVNGDIDVRMESLQSSSEMQFETVNGSVRVETPSSLDANVSLQTMHGSLVTDYPLTIQGRFGPRSASGTVGRGGRRIKLTTLNGNVELRKGR